MNELDKAIERILVKMVHDLKVNERLAEEMLANFRRHHRHHFLSAIRLQVFTQTEERSMASVTLTTAGQVATARIVDYLDQNGKPMPSDFVPPPIEYSIDDTAGAVVKVVDNGDSTATLTDVADGTATLIAKAKSAEGLDISDSLTITVSNGTPPEKPVLTSIKIGVDV